MNKFLIRFICCFIPSRNYRHFLRECRFGFYKIQGKNNKILFHEKFLPRFLKIKGLNIIIDGSNNLIKIGSGTTFSMCQMWLTHKARNVNISVGSNCELVKSFVLCAWSVDTNVYIGNKCHFYGAHIYAGGNEINVNIGDDCLMANPVEIWGGDGHAIIDKSTNMVINNSKKPLVIGNHCWLGQGSRILKNGNLPPNTVVAGGAVVTKTFTEEFTILGGNPAKVIKSNVLWDEASPYWKDRELRGL